MNSNQQESLENRTRRALASLGVAPSNTLLVAVSGGPDSTALLHALASLQGAYSALIVGHVHHGLRPEADREEEGVRSMSERLGIVCHVLRVDTAQQSAERGTGLEETARNVRYEFLTTLANDEQCDAILTAHTANDQAETILMHMMRGTGVHGLAGIPRERGLGTVRLLRPWLEIRREEIEGYLAAKGIIAFTDDSNAERDFERNRVRNLLVPKLRVVFPNRDPIETLVRLGARMGEIDRFLTNLADEKLEAALDGDRLRISALASLTPFLLKSIVELWFRRTSGYYTLDESEAERLDAWLKSDNPAIELRQGIRIRRTGAYLGIEERTRYAFSPTVLPVGERVETPYGHVEARLGALGTFDANKVYFDRAVLDRGELSIRSWRSADRIRPFGSGGRSKLVSDVLTEGRITGRKKENYPVVVSGEEVIWVPGLRRASLEPVTSETKLVLILEFEPNP